MATVAEKISMYREKAKDKTIPQDVRNTYLDRANELEMKEAEKAGVKMAKGGAVKKAPMKVAAKQPMKAPVKKMAKGGMAKKGCK
jgi:hypothetical protein